MADRVIERPASDRTALLRLPVAHEFGPLLIAALFVAYAALWMAVRPAGESTGSYLGQLLGAEAILLLSVGLVLISTLPWVEVWFDGIDRAAIWHRRVAITGLLLLLPHILLSANPRSSSLGVPLAVIGVVGLTALAAWAVLPRWRSVVPGPLRGIVVALSDAPGTGLVRRLLGGHERWRTLHRTTGLFVAAGFAHGVLDGTPFPDAPGGPGDRTGPPSEATTTACRTSGGQPIAVPKR